MPNNKADSTSKGVEKTPKKFHPKTFKRLPKIERLPNTKTSRSRKGKALDNVTSTGTLSFPSILEVSINKIKEPFSNGLMDLMDGKADITKHLESVNSQETSMSLTECYSSSSACFSSTRNKSSSSTTSCNTVETHLSKNDFFLFKKLMPQVFTKMENELNHENFTNIEVSKNSTTKTSDKCYTTSVSSNSTSSSNSAFRSVNTSTSSVTSIESHVASKEKTSAMTYALDKLRSKRQQLDLEFINWKEYDIENFEVHVMKEGGISNSFKEEFEVIKMCQNLKRVLSDDSTHDSISYNESTAETSPNAVLSENNVVKPVSNDTDKSLDNEFTSTKRRYEMFECCKDSKEVLQPTQAIDVDSSRDDFNLPLTDRSQAFKTNANYKAEHMTLDPNYDDDDELSLYAESLSDIESSELKSSNDAFKNNTDLEQFVHQPVSKDTDETPTTYCPTKTTDDEQIVNKTVNSNPELCKKQCADSTFIYREPDRDEVQTEIETKKRPIDVPRQLINKPTTSHLLFPGYKCKLKRSLVFKGVCHYDLVSKCNKNSRCMFSHETLNESIKKVNSKLKKLSIENFQQEYYTVRAYAILWRNYSMCFVTECKSRELTRLLVEMARDAILNANPKSKEDTELKVNIIEMALMHLNNVSLNTCADILEFCLESKFLCDVLMEIIAETQNFSRFKLVFIKLTDFIVQMGRKFSLGVASHILERICILPFERVLARTMLTVIQNTDEQIINDSMMPKFEQQLYDSDDDLHKTFLLFKKQVLESLLDSYNLHSPSPCFSHDVEEMHLAHPDRDRHTSPDTNKLDNLDKPTNRTNEPPVSIYGAYSKSMTKIKKRIQPTTSFGFKQLRLPASSSSNRQPLKQRRRRRPNSFEDLDSTRSKRTSGCRQVETNSMQSHRIAK